VIKEVEPADLQYLEEFRNSFMIIHMETHKCLDVTKADLSIGTQVCLYENNHRANQRWSLEPPLENQASESVKYSIINLLTGLRLWVDGSRGLIQSNNTERVWEIRRKHGKSGELYELNNKKYLNRVEEDRLCTSTHSNGTIW
jgi:hypothetical protein